ncbi:ABC transporter ATP-binding protein [Neorhizobium sp. NCHU2750]|uniref:dipeptide ABC transporter ATP-binding protein n=1 Tax=Neorhizobium sp. NCHU2750 TaxID=1825976 RepID=UPI000E75B801|nr:peptide/nickel ABC transporter ATP-binding protein [Neorhizobium sp. NCHU2750]
MSADKTVPLQAGPLLDVRGLQIKARTHSGLVPLVRDIDFSLDAGETLALVGESGSGKSLTALSIIDLLPTGVIRTAGTIRFGNLAIETLPQSRLRALRGKEIAVVFQDPQSSLNPAFTVGQQLADALRAHLPMSKTDAMRRATELLDLVRIPSASARVHSYPHEMSGGQRQRVAIAMALACSPKLLIADEPTTALDVTVQAQIMRLLADLRQELGLAVLMISHNLDLVSEICHRVAVMQNGEIIEQKEAARLFASPEQPYTKMLLDCIPRLSDPIIKPVRMSAPPTALQLENIDKSFTLRGGFFSKWIGKSQQLKALDNISLTVNEGEILGIVGESGSGKSTLGRIIARLATPSGGLLKFAGENLPASKARQAKLDVQMIFQDSASSLNPRKRVKHILGEALKAAGVPKENRKSEIQGLLRRCGLSEMMGERFPHALSGGQRQRVNIARAVAMKPRIIIADEPVSALDVSMQMQIIELLRKLNEETGVTLVFISHDLALVRKICDRVVVMNSGTIVETGDPVAVVDAPQHVYTKSLIAAVPRSQFE